MTTSAVVPRFLARARSLSPGQLASEYESAKQRAEGRPGFSQQITRPSSSVQARNRYSNVVTLEATRVRLPGADPDYINASFVGGGRFIAAQAPMPSTAGDFWAMCLGYRVPCVVMLTPFEEVAPSGGVREKSARYFPGRKGEVMRFEDEDEDIKVACTHVEELDEGLVKRTLAVQRGADKGTLTHLHFTAWPDFGHLDGDRLHGVITTLNAMKEAEKAARPPRASTSVSGSAVVTEPVPPPVVHCSAGIGRSGTFIALALILERLSRGELVEINVAEVVAELRNQRPFMVQTVGQFEMIYHALVAVLGGAEYQEGGGRAPATTAAAAATSPPPPAVPAARHSARSKSS